MCIELEYLYFFFTFVHTFSKNMFISKHMTVNKTYDKKK